MPQDRRIFNIIQPSIRMQLYPGPRKPAVNMLTRSLVCSVFLLLKIILCKKIIFPFQAKIPQNLTYFQIFLHIWFSRALKYVRFFSKILHKYVRKKHCWKLSFPFFRLRNLKRVHGPIAAHRPVESVSHVDVKRSPTEPD